MTIPFYVIQYFVGLDYNFISCRIGFDESFVGFYALCSYIIIIA